MNQPRKLHRNLGFAALLIATLTFVGCGAQPGTTVVRYNKDSTGDRLQPSPMAGLARLYGSSSATPEMSYNIKKGEQIGFRDERTETGGQVVAVAGEQETPISAGSVFDRTYYWKVSEDE